LRVALIFSLSALGLVAQTSFPGLPAPPPTPQASPNIDQRLQTTRPNAPAQNDINIQALRQEADGPWRYFRGNVIFETTDMQLKADELDYNADTGYTEARGHVHFEHFVRGEKLDCDKAEYNLNDETGKFYNVTGSAPSRIAARPGLMTTQSPFYFQGDWAERLEDHYILYNGFLTDCVMPKPWWIFKGPKFDIFPGDHAVVHDAWFRLRMIPLFYAPYFYKSLKKEPRKSGFLIPDFGNSSLHGYMAGFGYYWAINRSYDLTYRGIYYTGAGLANHVDFRGKVNDKTYFDVSAFGVLSTQPAASSDQGVRIGMTGRSELGDGWVAGGVLDYLSSFAFLQQFTQSFNEAVSSETHSVGFLTKHFDDYAINIVAQRDVNFQSTTPGDTIETRKLPEVQFLGREHEFDVDSLPVWFSFQSSAGLESRSQPAFQTRQFVDRLDVAPTVTTAFRWGSFELVPSFGVRDTEYGSSLAAPGTVSGTNYLRNSRNVSVDLIFPSLERIFDAPAWMGTKVKHVIEPRVTYTYVGGITNFDRIIRFDENDLLTDTNQLEFSLTNRLLAKAKDGTVTDFLSWQLLYDRYFDPTFGGAVVPGARNVIESSIDLTGYAFLDGPRNQSPVVSALRLQSKVGLEWRLDYDPVRHTLANSSVTVDGRIKQYFWSIGHTDLKSDPVLAPTADQARMTIGYGNSNRRGWNSGASVFYDLRQHILQFWQMQVTYNTDCCGLSVQYRRFSIGTRDDSQFQVSFAVANIGSAGTLKRQERVF